MVRSGRVNHEVNEHTGWYNHWGQVRTAWLASDY